MTQKEKIACLSAISNINAAIGEIKYYLKSDWLHDETALNYVERAESFLKEALGINKKKRKV